MKTFGAQKAITVLHSSPWNQKMTSILVMVLWKAKDQIYCQTHYVSKSFFRIRNNFRTIINNYIVVTAKLNAAKSTQSILEKENIHIINSIESLNEKKTFSDGSLKKSVKGSVEIIATTNSKGDIIPKRPDKLNIALNMNKKLTEEIEATFKSREKFNIDSMETVKLEDDIKGSILDDSDKDNTGSSFYADPVDALKEVSWP